MAACLPFAPGCRSNSCRSYPFASAFCRVHIFWSKRETQGKQHLGRKVWTLDMCASPISRASRLPTGFGHLLGEQSPHAEPGGIVRRPWRRMNRLHRSDGSSPKISWRAQRNNWEVSVFGVAAPFWVVVAGNQTENREAILGSPWSPKKTHPLDTPHGSPRKCKLVFLAPELFPSQVKLCLPFDNPRPVWVALPSLVHHPAQFHRVSTRVTLGSMLTLGSS